MSLPVLLRHLPLGTGPFTRCSCGQARGPEYPAHLMRLALSQALADVKLAWLADCGHPYTATCGRCHAYEKALDAILDTHNLLTNP